MGSDCYNLVRLLPVGKSFEGREDELAAGSKARSGQPVTGDGTRNGKRGVEAVGRMRARVQGVGEQARGRLRRSRRARGGCPGWLSLGIEEEDRLDPTRSESRVAAAFPHRDAEPPARPEGARRQLERRRRQVLERDRAGIGVDAQPVQAHRGQLVAQVRKAATDERPGQGRLSGARVADQEDGAVAGPYCAGVEEEEVRAQELQRDRQVALEREEELAVVCCAEGLATRALDAEPLGVAADRVLEVRLAGRLAALEPAEAMRKERRDP